MVQNGKTERYPISANENIPDMGEGVIESYFHFIYLPHTMF